jgi:hypothetical protein
VSAGVWSTTKPWSRHTSEHDRVGQLAVACEWALHLGFASLHGQLDSDCERVGLQPFQWDSFGVRRRKMTKSTSRLHPGRIHPLGP